jgi:3-phenylpropionate/trans-cinnamate dioxygenase ferredoxin subunit
MGPGQTRVKSYDVSVESGQALGEDVRHAEEQRIPAAAKAAGREPGPYVAETFRVYVEEDYVVVDV